MIYSYQVQSQIRICSNIFEFVLTPVKESLVFFPGQYVLISTATIQKMPCSVANAPSADGHLVLQLREGLLSKALLQNTAVTIEGPFGNWQPTPDRPCLLLAGGTGIAPVFSLCATEFWKNLHHPVVLYWGVQKPLELYHTERLANVKWVPVISHDTHDWTGRTGLVPEVAAADIQDFSKWQVFAAGPFDMVQMAFELFTAQGLSERYFYSDMKS